MQYKKVEVPDKTYWDDDIREAVDDAYSNAEGYASAYYLRYELKRRNMKIVTFKFLYAVGVLSFMTAVTLIATVVALAPSGFLK